MPPTRARPAPASRSAGARRRCRAPPPRGRGRTGRCRCGPGAGGAACARRTGGPGGTSGRGAPGRLVGSRDRARRRRRRPRRGSTGARQREGRVSVAASWMDLRASPEGLAGPSTAASREHSSPGPKEPAAGNFGTGRARSGGGRQTTRGALDRETDSRSSALGGDGILSPGRAGVGGEAKERHEAAAPRWLLIVRSDREALYAQLRLAFAGSRVVQVILDRRREERRRREVPVAVDQRRGDRRWPSLSPAEQDLWEHAGFRLVLRPHEIEVYESGR